MRRHTVVPILALCATLTACDRADTPTAPPPPDKASESLLGDLLGGLLGWITNPALRSQQFTTTSTVSASAHGGGKATAAGGTYHFAFAANRKSNGSLNGHAHLRIGSTRYNANVVCLGVRGDTAVIVGVVQTSSDAGAVGDTMLFTAIDNGGDRIGEPEFPAAGQAGTRCGTISPSATTLAVDAGNIHVEGSTPVTGPVVVGTVVGMGSYDLSGLPTGFETNITRLSDGTVSGSYTENDLFITLTSYVLTVSCLTLNGDTAYIGGTITSGTSNVGMEGGVIVVDNAPTTNPDQSSGIQFGNAQGFCNGAVPATLNNLTAGDIAITP
jgi:hypothetical protein